MSAEDPNRQISYCLEFYNSGYELLKEGTKAGCGATPIKSFKGGQKKDEEACKNECDKEKSCTHIWHRQQNGKCKLYSSCNGKSEQHAGKRFKKVGSRSNDQVSDSQASGTIGNQIPLNPSQKI